MYLKCPVCLQITSKGRMQSGCCCLWGIEDGAEPNGGLRGCVWPCCFWLMAPQDFSSRGNKIWGHKPCFTAGFCHVFTSENACFAKEARNYWSIPSLWLVTSHQQLCGIINLLKLNAQRVTQKHSILMQPCGREKASLGAAFRSSEKSQRFVSDSKAKCLPTSSSLKWIGRENVPSQNVKFEDGKSLKTDLKIQLEKISLWPQKPAASENQIVPKWLEKYKNVAPELLSSWRFFCLFFLNEVTSLLYGED